MLNFCVVSNPPKISTPAKEKKQRHKTRLFGSKSASVSNFFKPVKEIVKPQTAFDERYRDFFIRKDCFVAPIQSIPSSHDLDLQNPSFKSLRYSVLPKIPKIMLRTYKFLQFKEDHRPAFWGTFSKKSKKINGRRPLTKDEDLFDYDYDSEAEWEEADGEEINSEEEEEEEEESEEEMEDWIVPESLSPTKRKKFRSLDQVIIGPFFDGGCGHPEFENMKMVFFNNKRNAEEKSPQKRIKL